MGWNRTNRLLEVLIVTSACVFAWMTLRQDGAGSNPPEEKWRGASSVLTAGRRFTLQGTAGNRRHLYLGVQTTCLACNADKPFYKRLASETAERSDIDLIVLAGESVEAIDQWLLAGSIAPVERVVRLKSPALSGFVYTPTLFITSSDGTVTDFITGELTPEEEAVIVRRVRGEEQAPLQKHTFAAEATWTTFRQSGAQVLDVRSRKAFRQRPSPAAAHIPVDELSMRSRAELRMYRPVVIDCTREDWGYCRIAGAELIALGFRDVTVILPGEAH